MITGLNVTIGVFVLVFVFSGYLFLEKYIQDKKAKKATVVKTKAVDVKVENNMTPTERWDAHVESLSN